MPKQPGSRGSKSGGAGRGSQGQSRRGNAVSGRGAARFQDDSRGRGSQGESRGRGAQGESRGRGAQGESRAGQSRGGGGQSRGQGGFGGESRGRRFEGGSGGEFGSRGQGSSEGESRGRRFEGGSGGGFGSRGLGGAEGESRGRRFEGGSGGGFGSRGQSGSGGDSRGRRFEGGSGGGFGGSGQGSSEGESRGRRFEGGSGGGFGGRGQGSSAGESRGRGRGSEDRGFGRESRFGGDSRSRAPQSRGRQDERTPGDRESKSRDSVHINDDEIRTEDGTEMIFGKNAVLAFLEDVENEDSDSEFDDDDDAEDGEVDDSETQSDDKPDEDSDEGVDDEISDEDKSGVESSSSSSDVNHDEKITASKQAVAGPRGQVRKPEIGKIYLVTLDHPDRKIERIKQLAKSQRIPVVVCDRRKLDALVGPNQLHQGVAAQISAAEFWELSDFLSELKKASPDSLDGSVVAIVDGIEDPHNLGAIIRVAESAGLKGLLLPSRRAAGLTGIVAKTSAGALASLPIVRIHNLVQALEELKESGFWIAGLDSNQGDLYTKTDLVRPLALVVGSEGTGMSRLVKENCDMLLKIPMLGKTESLNASVAAGIVFYEVVRQLQAKGLVQS